MSRTNGSSEQDRITARVMSIQYDETDSGKLVVTLALRTASGERRVIEVYGAVPYGFIEESADSPYDRFPEEELKVVTGGYESYDGRELMQVATEKPETVGQLQSEYDETWEADVPFIRRCTADYDMSGYVSVPDSDSCTVSAIESVAWDDDPIEPRVCVYDIEVETPETFYEGFAEDAPNRVTLVTAYDTYREQYTVFALDPDRKIDTTQLRGELRSHWAGHDDAVRLSSVDIRFKRFGHESELLQAFVDYVDTRRFDVFTGWNAVEFDHTYILNRILSDDSVYAHALSDAGYVSSPDWRPERAVQGVPCVDLMNAFCEKLSYGEWESKALDFVADSVVGGGKVEGDSVSYNRDRTQYCVYNIVDVQLCVEMDRIRGIMSFWFLLAETCAIPLSDVGTTMIECEGYLFKHRDRDEILPTTQEPEIDDISGGLVLPGYEGVAEWTGVMDLKSLYPSSIITCNISRETMTTDISEADVIVPDMPLNYSEVDGDRIRPADMQWTPGKESCVGFTLDTEGILPKYLKRLFAERAEKKRERDKHEPGTPQYERYDQQQRAVKVVMNSFFGVSDHPYFRLSADGLGAAITSASRLVSWGGIQAIRDEGYEVIYGDTDSLFFSVPPESGDDPIPSSVEQMKEVTSAVNKSLTEVADMVQLPDEHPYLDGELHGNDRHLWLYEPEKLYERYMQAGKKKRYAGKIVWKEGSRVDKTDVTGYEMEKSDAPEATKEVQKEVIRRVLDGESFEDVSGYIQQQIAKFEAGGFPLSEIGFPTSINQPLDEYPNMPVKRACLYSNEHLKYNWAEGDNPWLIYVDRTRPGLPDTDVIAVSWTDEDLPEGFTINAAKHVEKAVQNPVESLTDALPYGWSELQSGRREQSVMDGW